MQRPAQDRSGYTYWMGTHMPSWVSKTAVPLFLSNRRLAHRKTFPRARGPVAIDSGGFTELAMYGEWRTTPRQYVTLLRRYRDEIGGLAWAASQDFMTEPQMLARTGLGVRAHQRLTVERFLELRSLAPELPIVPVLQGWLPGEHLRHIDDYAAAGIDIGREPLVGVGSICRRQATTEIRDLLVQLTGAGVAVHAFGVKAGGLTRLHEPVASSDSLSWSMAGRYRPGCAPGHRHEGNCLRFALAQRERLLASLPWASSTPAESAVH